MNNFHAPENIKITHIYVSRGYRNAPLARRGLKIYCFLFFFGKGSSLITFHFDSPGRFSSTYWLHRKCDFIMLPLWLVSLPFRLFFFFWYLFVFQNNFLYHLDKTFHSELISCHYSVSTAQPLLKTGRSSGDLNVIVTEGTYHRYRVDEN